MNTLCRQRYPDQRWIEADMRTIALGQRYDAIIAWDSFFHLPANDQRAMFRIFSEHATSGTLLLFTSGPRAGIAMGEISGHPLYHASLDTYHASLDTTEYQDLLAAHDFDD